MAGDGDFKGRDREVEREVHREIPRGRVDALADEPRLVSDSSGTCWRVSEVSGRYVPGAQGEACLVFESECAIRRVWHYPEQWRELSVPELIEVSWNR